MNISLFKKSEVLYLMSNSYKNSIGNNAIEHFLKEIGAPLIKTPRVTSLN